MRTVSIIMAVHNESRHLEKALLSIQQQDFQDWELIIVDDASVDDSYAIINKFSAEDTRIKPMRNSRNLGLAASLNRAFAGSEGALIARMDGDDQCFSSRLRLQVSFMQQNQEVDVLGAGAINVTDAGQILGEIYRRELHEDLVTVIYRENPFIHPTIMARRNFFVELGGYDERLRRAQDYDLWLRGYKKYRFHNLQTPLLYYRRSQRPKIRDAVYSGYVLWRSAQREKKVLRNGWYAFRPFAAAAFSRIKGIK